MSTKLTPAASTSIRSSPASGNGSGTSSTRSTSGPPASCARIAFIVSQLTSQRSTIHDPRSTLLEHPLGDRLQLHVARPFIDRANFRIAVELFGRIVFGVAVPAEQLERDRRHPLGNLRREELGHRP